MTEFKTAETGPVVTSDNNGQTNPCKVQQGDTLVMRRGRGHLSNRGEEGDTLVMR